ncbi:hypothetical protein RJ639_038681 [Escallonia herrerae]|uniref:Adenylate kinase isoenzyme 6 homolog n=1 Tax=Escallonia herrerae TaxID=1293975 RepID=A0AA89B850_9ASTE|nr:hypothetical protein RJ639_038681 [Escallonia herrerae]
MAQNGSISRKRPNILVTGTPGTGKTTTALAVAEATELRHINVSDLVKERSLHDVGTLDAHTWWEWGIQGQKEIDDDIIRGSDMINTTYHVLEVKCYAIVCDELEGVMEEGGNIVDYHGCDFFPERWFDLVVVLQTDNTVLYDRLSKRGYSGSKLSNNLDCEIFQMLLEEARESYSQDILMALKSDTIDDMSKNVAVLTDWSESWIPIAAPQ